MQIAMDSVTIFWLQITLSCFVCAIVAAWYVWPMLLSHPRHAALIPLIAVHVMRYVGMTLLVPGMIDPKLSRDFLSNAAYGDLLAAALALASIFALRNNWRFSIPLVWIFNTWGFLDLLNGVRGVLQLNVPSFNLGTLWYIYTFYAPVVVISHLLIFWILITRRS
ncbi:hypothetical protein [Bradyrhizobium guangdongense]|jgi:hypothetical protein|uniref:hypothetical protein n=1 Tax=Bradyrhizobium guangdongense TaxID=1325090 RepID=UPI001FD9ED34|nr:hypothetical protein [Bradyrhizobium guangdongense]